MSKETTNDDVAESTEDTTESGSILEKNVSRRTALISAGLIGSAAASQSASGVDIEVNKPGAADDDNPPAQGDDPVEVLSLTLESDDIIVDVDGSTGTGGDIEKPYLDDMDFPKTDPEVLPGDRVSNIEPEDRLVTTRDTNFDVSSDGDHIFQAPVFEALPATDTANQLTYYPYGHAFGDDPDPVPDGLPDTLNPAIGIKVDSIGIGQASKSVSGISFSSPGSGSGTFDDRTPSNVNYSGSIPGDGFSYVPGPPAKFSFADHRQEVTLRNVGNNNEIVEDEANQVGLSSLFSTIGSGNNGQIFQLETTDPILVIGDGYQDGTPQPVDGSIPSTATFVSAEEREGIVETDIVQQQIPDDLGSVATVTSNDGFTNHVFKDPAGDAVLRIPVLEGDSVTGIVDPVEKGDALGIIEGTPDQNDDIMLLSTGEIVPGDSIGSQAGSGNAFGSDTDGFYLDVVAATPDRNTLTPGSSFGGDDVVALEVEEINNPDIGTTDTRYLDSKGDVLDELEIQINELTRDEASVEVQDVDDVENINDDDGDIDGIVIRSTTEVDDAYDQNVAVSSVEISSLPGSPSSPGLFGSGTGTAHPETTDIVTDLGLQDGTFNAVNADTVVSDDIYKAQADPIDAAAQDSAENEQLGDFEVTNNGISEGEDATERVESKEETRTNDLVYRDSLNSSAGSAQDLGPTGSPNESTADRFGPNPGETQFHDGFDILELREPVEETASADVPHNPRGLGPGETNIDVYYGDRFDGIRVKNEGNLEGDNIENVQLGVMEPGESNNINGEMWTVEKQIGDDGFDAQDTIYWFSREDLAEVSTLLDFVYFGDNTEDENGSVEEQKPDELVNDNVDVDHTSELTVSINVVNANEVGSPDQFGDTALFEVMDLQETEVDGEFDTGTSSTSAESGLFFKGHGDRGDIAASDSVTGGANQVRLANLYDPNNSNVPVEYVYGDGSIDTQGLLDAIRDFRDNNIDTQRLLEAITKFR